MKGYRADLVFIVATLLTFLSSCITLFAPNVSVTDMRVEKRGNGYLVELSCRKPIQDVTAFISKDNWLIITLVGATVDFDGLRFRKPDDLVSSVQVVGYSTSVQLTLKLKESFRSCDIVHARSGDNIEISLFSQ